MDVRNRGRLLWRPWGGWLARPSDWIEAFVLAVLIAAGLVVVGLGVWAGHAMGEALAQPGPRAQAGEYAAVATGDALPVTGPGSDGLPLWRVPVTWPTRSGLAGGSVLVDRPVTAGEPVPVVVDGDGRPRAEQLGLAGAPVAVGLVTVLAGWSLLASLWLATGLMLARRHAAALDLEWKRVEPPWSGRRSK